MNIAASKSVGLRLFASLTLAVTGLAATAVAEAQVVVLNPAFISGQVEVGGEVINRVIVTASNPSDRATVTVIPPAGSTVVSYTLTVNVPEGTVQTYEVRATARTDDDLDSLVFPVQSVAVTEFFQTSAADFVLADPGFVEGSVIVTGGGSLDSAGIGVDGTISDATTQATGAGGGFFRLPVWPQSGFTLSCNATLVGGARVSRRISNVNVAARQTVFESCEVPTPIADAILFGTVAMPGPLTPSRHQVRAANSINLFLTEDGPYSFQLPTGRHSLFVQTRFNGNRQSFNHPRGSFDPPPPFPPLRYDLDAGEVLQVDVLSE